MNNKDLLSIARQRIAETIRQSSIVKDIKTTAKEIIKEAFVAIPKSFILKTEALSPRTKETHESLYKQEVDEFNKLSAKVTTLPKNGNTEYRAAKVNETFFLNGVKLHELYFANISDINSEIHTDSLPYMRLTRDWGSFDNWQYDFRSTCLAANEGWGILYYEPYRNRYYHCVVDSHNIGLPVSGIPIIVIDMWSHSYYKDYLNDKKAYVNAMMRELNWNVIEARMIIAERAKLHELFLVQPMYQTDTNNSYNQFALNANETPINKNQIVNPNDNLSTLEEEE